MTYQDVVLAAMRQAGQPMASHQLYELDACEGMTRQQISSAVGHLRKEGKLRAAWERVPGPSNGPKWVSTYELMPGEDLDSAIVAALAATCAQDAAPEAMTPRPPSLLAAAPKVHPWRQHGAFGKALPILEASPSLDDIAREAPGSAAEVEPPDEIAAGPDAADAELTAPAGTAFNQPQQEEMAMATEKKVCCGKCHPDHAPPLDEIDLDQTLLAIPERPAWVADLKAWLGPLPAGMAPHKLTADYRVQPSIGGLKIKIFDDGGGAYSVINARGLYLSCGELGRLDRYANALIWIFDAIAANVDIDEPYRPPGMDHPNPNAGWADDLTADGGFTAIDKMPW